MDTFILMEPNDIRMAGKAENADYAGKLKEYLNLRYEPVAIKLVKKGEALLGVPVWMTVPHGRNPGYFKVGESTQHSSLVSMTNDYCWHASQVGLYP